MANSTKFQRNKKQLVSVALDDIFESFNNETFNYLNCVKIGRIVSFDSSAQTASVQISYKIVVQDNNDGNKILQDYPLLINCPCFFFSGGDSYLTMPIAVGDSCLVLFCDRDIDNWFIQGEDKELNTYRMHDISDGFALVGIRNSLNKITDYLANGVRLKFDNNTYINIIKDVLNIKAATTNYTGNVNITGDLHVDGDITCTGDIFATKDLGCSGILTAGNGVTGTFATSVTVLNGIVTGGS